MTGWYILSAALSFAVSAALTPLIRRLAERWRVVDDPQTAPERKRHTQPIALLGGVSIVLTSLLMWWLLVGAGQMGQVDFPLKYVVGLSLAAILVAVGGARDDRFHLRPSRQLLWPILATLVIIASGIGIGVITNPFGGVIRLDAVRWQIFSWQGVPYVLTLWADLFTFAWLMVAMYTTKLLDGLDGLVSGLGVIGSLIIFLLTLRPEVHQPAVSLLALSLAGACAGFLLFNWHPAKIFLGEGGSLFIGFMLGVMAIISGGKIATALLILGLPILDLAWVVIYRLVVRRTSPFRTADRSHLHFRLLDAGLSVRQSVLILYAVITLFGVSTLFFRGVQKVYALAALVVVMILLASWVVRRARRGV